MPELPEVEAFNRYFRKNALNKKVKKVEVDNAGLVKVNERQFKSSLKGKHFTDTYRRGKYLFGKLNTGKWVIFHFGMTGYFDYGKRDPVPYGLVRFVFDSGHHLAYVTKRKLGWIDLTDDQEKYCKKKKLGMDALEITKKEFADVFSARAGNVKTTLMDQSIISGVGNIFSDEALFQAGISPERSCKAIDRKHFEKLYTILQKVLREVTSYREKGRTCPIAT